MAASSSDLASEINMENLNPDDSFESVSTNDPIERPTLLPIGDTVLEEARRFFYEALSILEVCQSEQANPIPPAAYPKDKTSTRLMLYEFIALSLVHEAEADVAATAIYEKRDMQRYFGPRIVWTKGMRNMRKSLQIWFALPLLTHR